MMYKTESGTSIDESIASGETIFYKSEFEAIEKARETRSYHYQVFDKHNVHVGYGVPK